MSTPAVPPGVNHTPGGLPLPQRGVFAAMEILPLIQSAAVEMRRLNAEWKALRVEADEKKATAKRTRANLVARLRVMGTEQTGNIPIRTSAERQEWADADADVQRAELEADLAQTVQMAAREAYHDAQSYYETVRQLMSVERDDLKREHGGQS